MIEQYQLVEKNLKGTDYVVSDLHGMYSLLMKKLDDIGFDKKTDRLFCVGDLVDRGEDSYKCLCLLNEDWFYSVIGNHEKMMRDGLIDNNSYQLWQMNGGGWIKEFEYDEDIYQSLCQLINNDCPIFIKVEHKSGKSVGISHASPPTKFDDSLKTVPFYDEFIWDRRMVSGYTSIDKVEGVTVSVHGHTILDRPKIINNSVWIDTGGFLSLDKFKDDDGDLTILSFEELFDMVEE